ncbi:MAG: hypothetical protein MJ053_03565 [Elusimicrobiaceae bacterium]|nr:hypothetical protein [Elusimicrobiaceae bacterium]
MKMPLTTHKKFILSWTLLLAGSMLSYGQPAKPSSLFQAAKNFPKAQVTRTLQARIERTYQQGLLLSHMDPRLERNFVDHHIGALLHANPQEMYPQVPFLTDEKQLSLYFVANNNRETLRQLPKDVRRFQQTQARLIDFQLHQRAPTHPPQEDIPWILHQLSDKTSYLFIGERHKFESVKTYTAQLITALRQQFPKRQIILFSEFLPEGEVAKHRKISTDYKVVWNAALEHNIELIGLEPQFVLDNSKLMFTSPTNPQAGNHIWSSYEGWRLRNQRWMEHLSYYRTQYPQALFVVYAGNAHVLYSEPYSLSAQFPKENTFVVALYPLTITSENGVDFQTSLFDFPTQGWFAGLRLLQFTTPQLTHLAGFDVQIKVPSSTK